MGANKLENEPLYWCRVPTKHNETWETFQSKNYVNRQFRWNGVDKAKEMTAL
jgi:hypothetical protein